MSVRPRVRWIVSAGRAVAFAGALLAAGPAPAHFLEIIPSSDVLPDGGTVRLELTFTHPFDGGPVMELERPAAVGVVANGSAADLSAALVETGRDGATAWTLEHELAEPGAAIFHVTPEPFWEPAEGKFIIHYAKVVVDAFATGEGWDGMVGLPVEILPLTRPGGVWAGNTFTGVVTRAGAAVPFAEVEVGFRNDGSLGAPNDLFATQVVKADANGTFTYAMPRAGWWGFAALLEGDTPMTSPDGRTVPVEEGALIWVHAAAMTP